MTTTVSTRSAGRLNPTRQQLDELDALLQRMLDLPVSPLEEPAQAEVEEPIDEPPPPVHTFSERPAPAEWSSPQQPVEDEHPPVQPAARPAPPPISYMVVETASPRPLPPASGFEPRPSMLAPRLVPVTPPPPVAPEPMPMKNVAQEVRSEEQPSSYSSLLTPPFVPTAAEPPVPEADAAEMWVPLRSTWQPSPQTWPPLAESWHQANHAAPPVAPTKPISNPRTEPTPPPVAAASRATPEARRAEPVLPPTLTEEVPMPSAPSLVPNVIEPRLSLSAADAPAAAPALLLPLLWFNQGFDACLTPLGAPGRWLCGRGRSILGFVGLACLVVAAVIALSAGLAWTW